MLIRRDEHNIDRPFRKKLHDAEVPVPLHLWENIRKRTKRRRLFLFWTMAAAVSIGTLFFVVAQQSEATKSDISQNLQPTTSESAPPLSNTIESAAKFP